MILKILMRIGNLKWIDDYVNIKILNKLSAKDLKKFVIWYLNQEYDAKTNNKECVFGILDVARKKFPLEELEELVINSRFMQSKPDKDFYYFFRFDDFLNSNGNLLNLEGMPLLQTYLTSRVTSNEALILLINNSAAIDYDYAFRKLASVGNIDTLLEYAKQLNQNEKYYHYGKHCQSELAKQMVLSGLYSCDEIERFFKEVVLRSETIVEIFIKFFEYTQENEKRNSVINTFISIIDFYQEKVDNGQENDSKTGDCLPGYDECAFSILKFSISMEMKNEISKNLLQNKNWCFINELFFNSFESDNDYDMIDALMKENVEVVEDTLSSISDKYLEYALVKLLNRDKDFINEVIAYILNDYDKLRYLFDIERIDTILDFIYYKFHDFKILKVWSINLIKLGSKYIPKFMSEFDFTKEEREDIFKSYKWMDSDFERVYGPYLLTGDKDYWISEEEAKEQFARFERCRRKK